VSTATFLYAVLRDALRTRREGRGKVGAGAGDEGMTTLEVLVITGALLALALGAVAVITSTAQGKVGSVTSPTSFLHT